jgi:DNA-damage-inducible protein J
MSTADVTLHIRIDGQVKHEADQVLAGLGLSVPQAIRMLLARIAAERALPFDPEVPNALTARTLAESDRGEELVRCADAEEMFERLGI